MGEHLVGIDVGTTGTKTAVFDTDLNLVASAFRDSRLYQPLPGIVEEDPEFMYRCVCETIAEALANGRVDPGSVKAVAMDGQMAGIMGIDADWHPVTPYDSWLDTRCAPYIAQMRERAGEAVTRSTGCAPTFAHGPKILWWRNERPEVYARVAKWVVPSAYLAGRLAGLKADEAYLDYTQHHFSGFGDVLAGAWNDELSRLFEVDSAKLPQVVAPWRVIGGVTTEAAADTGLTRGTPIMAGAGDQSAGSLGAGITSAGMIFDCAGTASVFSCSTQHFTPSVTTGTFISARSILPGLWVPLAYINGGGLCVRWFRDTFGTSGDPAWYGQLETEARDIPPGSEGLLFLPHFGGRVCPSDPEVRGAWLGLNWRHGRAHLYRAILEGIAYEYAFYLNELHELLPEQEFTAARVIGGGAKSPLFNQIKADVLSLPYEQLDQAEFAVLGSAIVAGYGVGLFTDMAAVAAKAARPLRTFSPDKAAHPAYRGYASEYRRLFAELGGVWHGLAGLRAGVR